MIHGRAEYGLIERLAHHLGISKCMSFRFSQSPLEFVFDGVHSVGGNC